MLNKNFIFGLAVVTGMLVLATPVHAQQVNIPPNLSLSGLTSDTPLAVDNASSKDASLISLVQFSPTAPTFAVPNSGNSSSYDIPVPTPIATPTEKPEPTSTPAGTPKATPTATPAVTLTSTGGLDADKLFSMVQDYRTSHNLPAFQTDTRACTVAQTRAPEVNEEIADGHMHSGLKAMDLPYWNTENIISMRTEAEAFNWWINDPIHHDAIVGDYKYSCLACSGNACAEEFTNFQPK